MEQKKYQIYEGTDVFTYNGEEMFQVKDFWKYHYSTLVNSVGVISEFLVGRALGVVYAANTIYWTAYDISYKDIRIEVKGTAYAHTWNKKNVSKTRVFSIAPTHNAYWDDPKNKDEEWSRQSDIFVFCLNNNKDLDNIDPLCIDDWIFYVVPTSKIDEYASKRQKTISLNVVKKLADRGVEYRELKQEIDRVIEMLK